MAVQPHSLQVPVKLQKTLTLLLSFFLESPPGGYVLFVRNNAVSVLFLPEEIPGFFPI